MDRQEARRRKEVREVDPPIYDEDLTEQDVIDQIDSLPLEIERERQEQE